MPRGSWSANLGQFWDSLSLSSLSLCVCDQSGLAEEAKASPRPHYETDDPPAQAAGLRSAPLCIPCPASLPPVSLSPSLSLTCLLTLSISRMVYLQGIRTKVEGPWMVRFFRLVHFSYNRKYLQWIRNFVPTKVEGPWMVSFFPASPLLLR